LNARRRALPQKSDLLSFRPGFSPVTRLAPKSRRTVFNGFLFFWPLEKLLSWNVLAHALMETVETVSWDFSKR
jgi:hypothetical protein